MRAAYDKLADMYERYCGYPIMISTKLRDAIYVARMALKGAIDGTVPSGLKIAYGYLWRSEQFELKYPSPIRTDHMNVLCMLDGLVDDDWNIEDCLQDIRKEFPKFQFDEAADCSLSFYSMTRDVFYINAAIHFLKHPTDSNQIKLTQSSEARLRKSVSPIINELSTPMLVGEAEATTTPPAHPAPAADTALTSIGEAEPTTTPAHPAPPAETAPMLTGKSDSHKAEAELPTRPHPSQLQQPQPAETTTRAEGEAVIHTPVQRLSFSFYATENPSTNAKLCQMQVTKRGVENRQNTNLAMWTTGLDVTLTDSELCKDIVAAQESRHRDDRYIQILCMRWYDWTLSGATDMVVAKDIAQDAHRLLGGNATSRYNTMRAYGALRCMLEEKYGVLPTQKYTEVMFESSIDSFSIIKKDVMEDPTMMRVAVEMAYTKYILADKTRPITQKTVKEIGEYLLEQCPQITLATPIQGHYFHNGSLMYRIVGREKAVTYDKLCMLTANHKAMKKYNDDKVRRDLDSCLFDPSSGMYWAIWAQDGKTSCEKLSTQQVKELGWATVEAEHEKTTVALAKKDEELRELRQECSQLRCDKQRLERMVPAVEAADDDVDFVSVDEFGY